MDHVIEVLNAAGQAFCVHAGRAFVQSSILIGVLLIFDFLLRRRVRAVVRYALWMLVFVKLLLPPTLALPTGIGYYRPQHTVAVVPETTEPIREASPAVVQPLSFPALPRTVDVIEAPIVAAPPTKAPVSVRPAIAWQAWVFLAWLAGVMVLCICLAGRFRYAGRLVRQSVAAPGLIQDVLAQCARMLSLRRCLDLRLSDDAPGPVVCGLVWPVVLMPVTFPGRVSEERLRTVLVHELAHIKRADLWVNFIQTLLLVAYFYHPLLWLVNAIVRRLREQAVDETVLVALDAEAESYSTTLIDLAEMTFTRPILGLRLIGIAESRKALEGRIRHMMTRPKPRTARVGLWGLLAISAIAAALLPMARAQSRGASEGTISQPSLEKAPTPLEFKATLPDGVTVELVGLCLPPFGPGQRWWRPDGTPMDGSEYEPRNVLRTRRLALGYLLRFSGSDQFTYRVPMQVDDLLFHPHGATADGWATVTARHSDDSMTGLPLSDRIDLEVDVAGGMWETSEGIGTVRDWLASGMGGMGGTRGMQEMKRELCPRSLYLPDGKAVVLSGLRPNPEATGPRTLIEMTSTAASMDVRLQCVASDGETHEAQVLSHRGGGPTGMLQCACGFDVAMEDIERLVFKYRPYHRVTFRNVSLRPGEKTGVQVQTTAASGAGGEPGLPHGAGFEARAVSGTRLMDLDKALRIYADDHDDRFPDRMADAVDCYPINLPWLEQHVVYLGQGKTMSASPDTVLAYDKTMLEQGKGTVVLFAKSHVDFRSRRELDTLGIASASGQGIDPRERAVSRTQLLDLGKALLIYANDHDDRFPEHLSDLRDEVGVGIYWLLENVTYLGKDILPTDHPARVLAYDGTLLEKGQGTNVLYLDAHVAFETPEGLEKLGVELALKSTAVSQEETGEQARETALDYLKQLALAVHMFADDHSGIFVANPAVLEPYLAPDKQLRTWIYRNVELAVESGKLTGGVEGSKKPLAYWKNPPATLDGTAVAFQDGHAKFVSSTQLAELGIEIQR